MRLLQYLLVVVGLVACLGRRNEKARAVQSLDEDFGEEDYDTLDDTETAVRGRRESKEREALSRRKAKTKHVDREEPEKSPKEDDGPIAICDGTEDEACHCTLNEVYCSGVVFADADEDGEVLDTLDLRLDTKDKNFKAFIGFFNDNAITSLRKNRMPEGMEDTLSDLHIDHNKISTIEAGAFTGFTNISKLHLQFNRLSTVKSEWWEGDIAKTLHTLDLRHNAISEFGSKPFEPLRSLRKLTLDENPLKITKDTFVGLDNLETLSLDNCDLTTLESAWFKPLPKLKNLSLRGNNFTEVPAILTRFEGLRVLDLSENPISELHSESFIGDISIQSMYFLNMPFLQRIDSCAFCGVNKLTALYFSNSSRLTYINDNAFGIKDDDVDRVTTLEQLHIAYTNVSIIDKDLLYWAKVTDLNMEGIPLNCACEIAFLTNPRHNSGAYQSPRCATPEYLFKKYFSDLTSVELCSGGAIKMMSNRFTIILASVLCVTVIVIGGYLLISSGYRVTNIRAALPSFSTAQVRAYANLNRDDDGDVLEMDAPNGGSINDGALPDFEPRPQAV